MYTVSVLLAFVLGAGFIFFAFVNAFAGSTSILNQWEKDNYNVNYVVSSGFSGSGVYYYELEKHTAFGLLEATLDKSEVSDSLCDVQLFDKTASRIVHFDHCKEVIQIPE